MENLISMIFSVASVNFGTSQWVLTRTHIFSHLGFGLNTPLHIAFNFKLPSTIFLSVYFGDRGLCFVLSQTRYTLVSPSSRVHRVVRRTFKSHRRLAKQKVSSSRTTELYNCRGLQLLLASHESRLHARGTCSTRATPKHRQKKSARKYTIVPYELQ